MAECHSLLPLPLGFVLASLASSTTQAVRSAPFSNIIILGKENCLLGGHMSAIRTPLLRTLAKQVGAEVTRARLSLGLSNSSCHEHLSGGWSAVRLPPCGGRRNSVACAKSNDEEDFADDTPAPITVPYDLNARNNVVLTGRLQEDPAMKWLDQYLMTRLTLVVDGEEKMPDGKLKDPNSVIPVACFGQLAETVANHTKKNHLVRVHGYLNSVGPNILEVFASELYFVGEGKGASGANSRFSTSAATSTRYAPAAAAAASPVARPQGTPMPKERTAELWDLLLSSPSRFWDNRFNKRNPRAPDFVNKETRESLWIDSWKNPPGLIDRLEAAGLGPAGERQ